MKQVLKVGACISYGSRCYHMQQVYRVEQENHIEDCTQQPAADIPPSPVWLLAQQFGVTL